MSSVSTNRIDMVEDLKDEIMSEKKDASIDYSLFGGAETIYPPTSEYKVSYSSQGSHPISSSSSSSSARSVSPISSESDSQPSTELHHRSSQSRGTISNDDTPANHQTMPKDPNDFLWIMTEEPHRSRRKAILQSHPEVRKLMGYTKTTFPLVLAVVSIQILMAISLSETHPLSWKFLTLAYVVGGTANQNLFLSIHEITHNLAFKRLLPNKLLAMVANIPVGVPFAMAFKGYHIEHHKFLGEDGIDTDLPSKFEAVVLNNVAGKCFFAIFQILFYALRPGFIRSQTPTIYHALNFSFIIFTNTLLYHFYGWYPIFYFLFSSFFAGSLHPCAAHFIAEHYLMSEDAVMEFEVPAEGGVMTDGKKGNEASGAGPGIGQMIIKDQRPNLDHIRQMSQETASYYGWLNILCYNVGYHNEHHDFPSIPWTRLPALHRIAKEYYEPLPSHPSWPAVTWRFITDPKIGMWSRAKRESGNKGERIEEEEWKVCEKKNEGMGGKGIQKQEQEEEEEEEMMDKLMKEAVERGYGSDAEEKR